jgi:hypothetical protein
VASLRHCFIKSNLRIATASGWLERFVRSSGKSRIWFRQELDFGKHTQAVAAANGTIADVMFALSALRLNDDGWNMLPICMNDGAMGQADVDMNRSDLFCVSEIKNGPSILHVLLDRNTTA